MFVFFPIHFIVFAESGANSPCEQILSIHGFNQTKIQQLIQTVNSKYECGNTFSGDGNPPYVTIVPIFDPKKGVSEAAFLKQVFADIIKSQNDYFKANNMHCHFSNTGFPNKDAFYEAWRDAYVRINYCTSYVITDN